MNRKQIIFGQIALAVSVSSLASAQAGESPLLPSDCDPCGEIRRETFIDQSVFRADRLVDDRTLCFCDIEAGKDGKHRFVEVFRNESRSAGDDLSPYWRQVREVEQDPDGQWIVTRLERMVDWQLLVDANSPALPQEDGPPAGMGTPFVVNLFQDFFVGVLSEQVVRIPIDEGTDVLVVGRMPSAVPMMMPEYRVNEDEAFDYLQRALSTDSEYGVSSDYVLETAQQATTEPLLSWQWGLCRIGAEGNRPGTTDRVTVAVIDTGIDTANKDLANATVSAVDCIRDGKRCIEKSGVYRCADDSSLDCSGHGSHVAGILAAEDGNQVLFKGLGAFKLLGLRAFNAEGIGKLSDVLQAINYAQDNGAKVVTAAWSGEILAGHLDGDPPQAFHQLALTDQPGPESLLKKIRHASKILFVVAAGNDGRDLGETPSVYPAAFHEEDNVLVVGATDWCDGPTAGTNFGRPVHLGAPGRSIWSTWRELADRNCSSTSPHTCFASGTGTSASTAYAAGAAGILAAKCDQATPAKLKKWLIEGASSLPNLCGCWNGGTRLDVAGALACAGNCNGGGTCVTSSCVMISGQPPPACRPSTCQGQPEWCP